MTKRSVYSRATILSGALGGVLLTSLVPMAAPAQEALELDTLVVDVEDAEAGGYIATEARGTLKSAAPLTETPRSISQVTQQELRDRAPQQLEDAIAYTAGVTSSVWGVDDRFTQFTLRGFDLGTSGIYRDGLTNKVLNFSGFTIDPYMIESIDVLRGPASVLYGENDAAGMINATTKRPRFERIAEAFASYGSHDTKAAGLDLGGALGGSGRLAYRLTAKLQDGANEVDGSENDRLLIAPSLTWQVTPDTEVTFLAHYQKDALTPNQFLPVAGEDYAEALGSLSDSFVFDQSGFNRFDTEQTSIGYQVEHDFTPDLTFRQNLRWQRQDTDYRHLYYNGMADADTMAYAAFTVDERATRLGIDNQLEWRSILGGAENTFLAGLDYSRSEIEGKNGYDGSYTIELSDPNYDFAVASPGLYLDRTQTTEQTGLYFQNTARFANGLTLVGGLRKSWIGTELDDHLGGGDSDAEYDALTGMAGVSYAMANGITPYASYTESFSTNSGTDAGGDLFEPTEGRQVEAGVKWAPSNGRGLVTLALFDMEKANLLTSDLANPGFSVQTGEVRHRGLELEAKADLGAGISLAASYTYLDAEITQSNDGDEGNRPSLVPEHQAALWGRYEAQGGRFDGLSLGAGLRFVGETWGDNGNTRKVDEYFVADMTVGYEIGDYDLNVGVTNLFDNDYYATCDPFAGCILGEGREITATLSRSF